MSYSAIELVGRAVTGLAVGGEDGVARALAIIKEEFGTVMQLMGCETTSALTRAHVYDRSPATYLSGGGDVDASNKVAMSWWTASASAAVVAVAGFAAGRLLR